MCIYHNYVLPILKFPITSILPSLQDEVAAMKEEDGGASGGEELADNSDQDSDASSHFGLAKKGKSSKNPKPKRSSKGAETKPQAGTSASPSANKQEESDTKVKAALEQASKALGSLTLVDAKALWKNSFKDADLQARLKKVTQAETTLSQICATLTDGCPSKIELDEKITALHAKVNSIVPVQDAFSRLRSAKALLPELKDSQFQDELVKVCEHLDSETLADMLTTMGRKVSEAGHGGSRG